MTISERPYGSWPTPINSELVVAASVRLSGLRVDGPAVVWSEGRPADGGRTQLVRHAEDGTTSDLLPGEYNARTAVHEYGGAAWWVRDGVTWFVNWADQRLYRLAPGGTPQPLTPAPDLPCGDRYADGDLSPDGATIVCIRERHVAGGGPAQVHNEIVQLPSDPPNEPRESGNLPGRVGASPRSESPALPEPEVLVSGPDFVAAPRLSPDGATLAYLRWEHPSMPWDATELVTVTDGVETVVAGGPAESVLEPRWTPDGALWFLSDRTGWWNLYRLAAPGADVEAMVTLDAEIGQPAWALGSARYAVLADGRVVFARQSDGYDTLAVRAPDGQVRALGLPFSAYLMVRAAGPSTVVVVAGSPTEEPSVNAVALDTSGRVSVRVLRTPRELGLDAGYLSVPEHVSFPSTAPDGCGVDGTGRIAHALYYPPANPACRAPDGELPPLLVVIHGGPTGSAVPVLALELQYWTSRGFAVVDVNYGGSTGYGRAYREQLLGNWGVVDVADCLAAASWLAGQGLADPRRLCIRGGSAGGYTTLAALVGADTPFAAGADHYGVSDLVALAAETHKFESRYTDRLVGPYPEAHEVYVERSPISHVAELHRPLICCRAARMRWCRRGSRR